MKAAQREEQKAKERAVKMAVRAAKKQAADEARERARRAKVWRLRLCERVCGLGDQCVIICQSAWPLLRLNYERRN